MESLGLNPRGLLFFSRVSRCTFGDFSGLSMGKEVFPWILRYPTLCPGEPSSTPNPPLHFKRSASQLPSGPWTATRLLGVGVGGQSRSSLVRSPGYRGHSRVQADFLKRHHFSRQLVFGFVYNSVRALSDFFHLLEVLHEALASRVARPWSGGLGTLQKAGPDSRRRRRGKQSSAPWPQVGMERSLCLALVNLSNLKQCCRLPHQFPTATRGPSPPSRVSLAPPPALPIGGRQRGPGEPGEPRAPRGERHRPGQVCF